MGEEGVEGGSDLADLGPLVGEVVGDPLGEVDVALGQGQLGDAWAVAATSVSGRSWRRTSSSPPPAASSAPSAIRRASQPISEVMASSTWSVGSPRDLGAEGAVHRDHPVGAEAGQVDLVHLLVGRYVGEGVEDVVRQVGDSRCAR